MLAEEGDSAFAVMGPPKMLTALPGIHPSSLTVSNVVSVSRIAVPANDLGPVIGHCSCVADDGWTRLPASCH